jgi:hypothetical protein
MICDSPSRDERCCHSRNGSLCADSDSYRPITSWWHCAFRYSEISVQFNLTLLSVVSNSNSGHTDNYCETNYARFLINSSTECVLSMSVVGTMIRTHANHYPAGQGRHLVKSLGDKSRGFTVSGHHRTRTRRRISFLPRLEVTPEHADVSAGWESASVAPPRPRPDNSRRTPNGRV